MISYSLIDGIICIHNRCILLVIKSVISLVIGLELLVIVIHQVIIGSTLCLLLLDMGTTASFSITK